MNRLLTGCLVGAAIGAFFVLAMQSDRPTDALPAGTAFAQQAPSAYQPPPTAVAPAAALTPEEQANIRVYEVANPGVVNITTSTVQYDRMFGMPIGGTGAGSGSVIDRQGHILTNNHVIEDATEIEVTLANGAIYPAELIGADAEYDIAVIKISAPADELFPIQLGTSQGLRVGQKAYAVGNPFGLEGSLTVGIISSLNRAVDSRVRDRAMTGMIQTDAAMNPGNSGGPLLNSSAQMIGMNVAIASKTGQNSGVAFAIPVDRIRRFLPELIEHGKVLRAYHGIVYLMETGQGLRIAKLSRGSPAEQAGLRGIRIIRRQQRRGPVVYVETQRDVEHADTIVAIDGVAVSSHTDFVELMDRYKPGDVVTFTVIREGQQQQAQLTLGAA